MAKSRRDFLQVSATAATALTFRPLTSAVAAEQAQFPAVKTFEARMLKAKPVPLANVRLTGGPLKHAQDITGAYLLSLEPDRMMAFYRVRAGLAKKAEPYTGWDGAGRNLTGHIAGHHLSAVSLMYAATGDAKFKERTDYLVRELDLKRKAVLKWGPMGTQQLSEIRAGKFLLMGFAGNSAPDHVDELHSLPAYLKLLK